MIRWVAGAGAATRWVGFNVTGASVAAGVVMTALTFGLVLLEPSIPSGQAPDATWTRRSRWAS